MMNGLTKRGEKDEWTQEDQEQKLRRHPERKRMKGRGKHGNEDEDDGRSRR
jgi:hypothetical protein